MPTATATEGYQIGNTPLLSKEEAATLGRFVQDGIAAQAELEALDEALDESAASGNPPSPHDKRARLKLKRRISDGMHARDRFVQANMRLVQSRLKRRSMAIPNGVEAADLYQAGVMGLFKAVEKFKPEKGFMFSTYAIRWIDQKIGDEIKRTRVLLSGTTQASEQARKAANAYRNLTALKGRQATDAEVADLLGITKEKLLINKLVTSPIVSLDQPLRSYDDEAPSLSETLVDPSAEDAFLAPEASDSAEIANVLLNALPDQEREAFILEMHPDKKELLQDVSPKKHRADLHRGRSRLRHPSAGHCGLAADFL